MKEKYCKRCHSQLNPKITGDNEYHEYCEEAEIIEKYEEE